MAEEIVDIGYIDMTVDPNGSMTRTNRFAEATDIETLMRYVVGAGSMCWTDVRRAGTFETDGANAIADAAAARARELLATVRPDPDDARQVEVVARAIADHEWGVWDREDRYGRSGCSCGAPVMPGRYASHVARAVLAALAAMGGEQS